MSPSRWAVQRKPLFGRSLLGIPFSPRPRSLNVFQGLPPGFGESPLDEDEAEGADQGINPEGSSGAQVMVEARKSVSQDERANPKRGNRNGYRQPTHSVGKDFRDDDPSHRREGHGIAANRCYHQGKRI